MASTSVNIHNNSDKAIHAKLLWAASLIGEVRIQPRSSGQIGCEYVWYDLFILDNNDGKDLCKSLGIYGHTTCEVVNENGKYLVRRY